MIGNELLRFNKEQKYAILDCESCNLNLADTANLPWQWAWVTCTMNQVLTRESCFVKWPNLNVSKDAARVTGFSQRKIDMMGQDPLDVLEKIDKLVYDPEYKIVMHNGLNFDVYLHNIHRRALDRPTDYSYMDRMLDSNALAKSLKLGIKPQNDENLLAFQYRFTNYVQKGLKSSIMVLCDEFNIPYDHSGAHDAQWDVETLRKIFFKLLYQLEI